MAKKPDEFWFVPFYELDPSKNQCIHFTKHAPYTRCKAWMGERDHSRAIELRRAIIAASSETVSLEQIIEYILYSCCTSATPAGHRQTIVDNGRLMPLARRWQDEIRTHAVSRPIPTFSTPALQDDTFSTQYPPTTSVTPAAGYTTTNYNSAASPNHQLSAEERSASQSKSSNAQEPSTSQSKSSSDDLRPSKPSLDFETLAIRSVYPESERPPLKIQQPHTSQLYPDNKRKSSNEGFSMIHDGISKFYTGVVSKGSYTYFRSPHAAKKITLKAFWDIPLVLRDQFSPDTMLSSVLTITGSATAAQAATCQKFIEQTWSIEGNLLLKGVEKSVQRLNLSQNNEKDSSSNICDVEVDEGVFHCSSKPKIKTLFNIDAC